MTRVGIKTLKNKLSAYLRRVRRGDVLLVTDRDSIIAEIRPAQGERGRASRLESKLRRMAERGEVTLRTSHARGWTVEPLPGGPLPITSQQILDDLRSDGR